MNEKIMLIKRKENMLSWNNCQKRTKMLENMLNLDESRYGEILSISKWNVIIIKGLKLLKIIMTIFIKNKVLNVTIKLFI